MPSDTNASGGSNTGHLPDPGQLQQHQPASPPSSSGTGSSGSSKSRKSNKKLRSQDKQQSKSQGKTAPKFAGAESKMNGHVYQCTGEPQLLEPIITKFQENNLVEPAEPAKDASRATVLKWELSMKKYVKDQ